MENNTSMENTSTVIEEKAPVIEVPAEAPAEEAPVKGVCIELEGVTYTLTFNRDAIKRMESRGFSFNNLDSKMVTSFDQILEGSFEANHAYLKQERKKELVDLIYRDYEDDVQEIVTILIEIMGRCIPKSAPKDHKRNFTILR